MMNSYFNNSLRSYITLNISLLLLAFFGLHQTNYGQTIDIGPNQYAFQYTINPNFGLFFNSSSGQYEFRNGNADAVFSIGASNGELRTDLSFTTGSNLLVGSDQYAFRFDNQPNFGLFFNGTDSRYEFLNGDANPIFGFSALNGQLVTDLQFDPAASYKVAPNNYAIRSALNANIGLYFGPSDYEFRNSAGTSVLNINANTGELISTSSITASGIAVEGSSGTVQINSDGFLGGTSKLGLSNFSVENAYIQTTLGLLQIMNTTENGQIAFGNNNILHSVFDIDGRLGINTNVPNARLQVVGKLDNPENVIAATVSYNGEENISGVDAISVPAPGFGYGVRATGGFMAVRGTGSGQNFSGTTYGVYGESIGTAGTRIGVYGTANGGSSNWAMYAAGNSYVSGDLRIGDLDGADGYKFSVDGRAICEEMRVLLSDDWPDYVFSETYELKTLNEVDAFIKQHNHLPGIPSAQEIQDNKGINLGEMQRLTVEKIEELTLYLIEANQRLDELSKQNDQLKKELEALKND